MHVVVHIGSTAEEILKWGLKHQVALSEEWAEWIRKIMPRAQGFCVSYGYDNTDVLIWLEKEPKTCREHGTLWHEISHAVDRIAKNCDGNSYFFADDMSSEPRAFLYEYIAVEIMAKLWKGNK